MLRYNQLSQTAREVVRLLFLSQQHTASADQLASQTYYPDAEVLATLTELEQDGVVNRNDVGHYVLAAAMVMQLLPRQHRADTLLREGLALTRQVLETMNREDLSPDEAEEQFRAQMNKLKRSLDTNDG